MHSQHNRFQIALLFGLLLLASTELFYFIYIVSETYIAGPVQDSWGIIPYIKNTLASNNWFARELWYPQNSHRLVLLRLEFLIDYRYFHGSNVFLMTLSGLLIAAETLLLAWALNISKKSYITQWVILLSVITLIIYPTITWGFLHIFNIHMLQYAFFALLSCVLISKSFSENNNALFFAGILAAILCNFASFSISTIWPALILLLLLNKADKYRITLLTGIAIIFSYTYLQWLPGINGQGTQEILAPLADLVTAQQNIFISPQTYLWLLQHLISYLSLPPTEQPWLQLLTLLTLIWFVFGCYKALKYPTQQEEKTALSLMCFGICLGLTTAVGRGYLGDLSTGDRFQPMVVIYWAGFIIHILLACRNYRKDFLFNFCTVAVVCFIAVSSFINARDMGKKLSEDYTRFAKMQMAYLSDNLGENAIYENMVADWRKESYAGIVDAIPYLKENKLGLFNTPLARHIEQHKQINFTRREICINGLFVEKSRNNDPLIRNVVFESQNKSDGKQYPYLLIYNNQVLNGIAFRKRSPLPDFLQRNHANKSIWLGITRRPSSIENTVLIATKDGSASCQVLINNISAAGKVASN